MSSGDSCLEPKEETGPQNGSLTAADYLESQLQLEKDAREAMPYEPDKCTYPQPLRQLIFACLTCRKLNGGADIGVCYLCLIQCHSTHELVELFSRRNFTCDCGTSRMKLGKACAIRSRHTPEYSRAGISGIPKMRSGSFSGPSASPSPFSLPDLPPASDIESLGNLYNQNFAGRFCSCKVLYNPIKETQTMHQCYLGDVCGEDWFHQECILGYKQGTFAKSVFAGSGENKLDELPPPGTDAASETVAKWAADSQKEEKQNTEEVVPHFLDVDTFDEFVCWKCVAKHRPAFDELVKHNDIVVTSRPHFSDVTSAESWASFNKKLENVDDEPLVKRPKTELCSLSRLQVHYSIFLAENSHLRLAKLKDMLPSSLPIHQLLVRFDFLTCEDPIYQPVEEDVASTQASEGSLYDLGSTALLSLPIPQALEGLQAYDTMKEKLKGFFKDFVDQKKVVTEEEVRDFFGKMREK